MPADPHTDSQYCELGVVSMINRLECWEVTQHQVTDDDAENR